jgi:bifunctional non-homologous end joining protein LigD
VLTCSEKKRQYRDRKHDSAYTDALVITYLDLAELTSASVPFNRSGWIFELKYDGFRMVAAHRGGGADLVSRRGTDFADRFPEIMTELLELPHVVLDGELVVLDAAGRPQFDRLVKRSRRTRRFLIDNAARSAPACLFAFDILELDGKDLRGKPLLQRKDALHAVLTSGTRIRYTGHIEEDGAALFKVATQLRLEGIVAKRGDAVYPRGRSSDWVKIKTAHGKLADAGRAKWNES